LLAVSEVVAELQDPEEADAFLTAMLSSAEYLRLRKRWTAFQYKCGGMTHREAAKAAGISVATATRVAALLPHGHPILQRLSRRAAKVKSEARRRRQR